MTLVDLAGHLRGEADEKLRWKLVWEFFEEYRWEPPEVQVTLVRAEPPPTGDERWDALFAAISEHLLAQHDLAPPEWTEPRILRRPWFPGELPILRADALVRLGVLLAKKGNLDGAIELFRQAIELHANDSRAIYNYGLALSKKGDRDAGIEQVRRALAIAPFDPEAAGRPPRPRTGRPALGSASSTGHLGGP